MVLFQKESFYGIKLKFCYLCDMEEKRIKYPIGIQDFASLRRDGFIYVDKTDLIYEIVTRSKYLTIKGYDKEWDEFKLGIPNKEVEEGLFNNLMKIYQEIPEEEGKTYLKGMIKAIRKGDPQELLERLKSFLSRIPNNVTQNSKELYFENNLYIIFQLIGIYCNLELTTSEGRVDIFIKEGNYVYIIELKLDKSAEEALSQINRKDYTLPWKFDGDRIFKIGVSFSSTSRNIKEWIIEG